MHNGHAYDGEPIDDPRPPLLCLHGFPEYWGCWAEVAPFLSDDHLVVIPDQRGCGRSGMPQGAGNYTAPHLVTDMLELATAFFGGRRFDLAGHDFGASVAYALVFTAPERVDRLVIVNGAHPVCLQEALIDDPEQAAASEYFHTVREPDAGAKAAADDFRSSFENIEQHSARPWLTDDLRARYRDAWEGPERLDAMFNWYRSSPIVVPVIGRELPEAPLYGATSQNFRVPMPHLLVWGLDDKALLPESRTRLPEFCDDLTVREVEGADHWILHTHPEVAASLIGTYLART
ncbi:MAG: alpha/beta hydrolase [Solirubrobacterales bacterium]